MPDPRPDLTEFQESPERLGELLRRADAAAPAPTMESANLADRVRWRARRRRQTRIGGVAVAAAIFLAAGMLVWRSVHPAASITENRSPAQAAASDAPIPPNALDAAALRAEIARLKLEAEVRAAVAQRMMDLQTRAKKPGGAADARATLDPSTALRLEVDQAALALVYQADAKTRSPDLRSAAAESYRFVLTQFPQTPAAALAKQRLVELENKPGEPS